MQNYRCIYSSFFEKCFDWHIDSFGLAKALTLLHISISLVNKDIKTKYPKILDIPGLLTRKYLPRLMYTRINIKIYFELILILKVYIKNWRGTLTWTLCNLQGRANR